MTYFVRVTIFFLFFDFLLHVLHECVLGVGDDHLPTAVTGTTSARGSNACQNTAAGQNCGDSMVGGAGDGQFWKRLQAQQFLGTTAPFVWVSVTIELTFGLFFDD